MKKVIEFKQEPSKKASESDKKVSKKRKWIIASTILMVLLLIVIVVVYNANRNFRNFMDKYIFFKNVSEENVPIIEIDYTSNTNVIAYGKMVCVLKENTLFQYNSSGKKEKEVRVEINHPIYDVNNKYLVIGEANNQKLYLITGDHIVWEKSVEGNLSKVTVNKNGYVSAIVTGTTYKSIIITYDEKGKELFKTYLANNIAVDSCVSPDNSQLAYAEISTTGTAVLSKIKIISMDEVKEKNTEAKYTYEAPQNNLVMRIKYQDKNQLVAMYEEEIHILQEGTDTLVLDLNEEGKKITFADIKLERYVVRTVEQSTGLFHANTIVEMKNLNNQKESVYTAENVAKSMITSQNIIALNLGAEVEFINTNGWLVKRYTSTQEIKDIVICDGLAGVIYRDKIELVTL